MDRWKYYAIAALAALSTVATCVTVFAQAPTFGNSHGKEWRENAIHRRLEDYVPLRDVQCATACPRRAKGNYHSGPGNRRQDSRSLTRVRFPRIRPQTGSSGPPIAPMAMWPTASMAVGATLSTRSASTCGLLRDVVFRRLGASRSPACSRSACRWRPRKPQSRGRSRPTTCRSCFRAAERQGPNQARPAVDPERTRGHRTAVAPAADHQSAQRLTGWLMKSRLPSSIPQWRSRS